eukprot:GFUD01085734.1.p1 GENE.GFUD01085734.1~~GFUD01085734.1.p1  ORF type:complete len:103 (+),score=0.34 GFUD01085734.1:48-356(+)
MVSCGACGENIDISHKPEHHHNIAQCNSCNEFIPTMNAPAGSKYIIYHLLNVLTCGGVGTWNWIFWNLWNLCGLPYNVRFLSLLLTLFVVVPLLLLLLSLLV